MKIDAFTVLVFGLFIKVILGTLLLVFSFNSRSRWFAWCSAGLFCGCAASALFILRLGGPDFPSVVFGNAALVAAFSCCWVAARAFDRRPPQYLAALAFPLAWMFACTLPDFLDDVSYRIVVSSFLVTPLLGLTAWEFWRGREEKLPSRMPLIVLFSSFAVFFAARIPFVGMLPFPFGGLAMDPGWVGVFNLGMFFHTLIVAVLAVAINRERLELDQRNNALTDALTGAPNRRAFATRGARLLSRMEFERKPLCLLFLDIDHFKMLNDRFGHSGGDDMLQSFVALVQDNIRPTDFLFRMGGEEFCCLLPATNTGQAHQVAERIRHKFEIATVDVGGNPVRATVSIGIASTETFGHDLDALMRRADMAVYAAKRQGRNRVVVATGAEEPPDVGTRAGDRTAPQFAISVSS